MVYNTLNSYWLWKELATFLKVSNPTYRYWKETQSFKLNNKYVFLRKNTLPQKYEYAQYHLTDLSGYLPVKYASDRLNIDSHTFTYNKMALYSQFEYKYVEDIKFVNLKRFFLENGIKIKKDSLFHLGRINSLDITLDSTFYKINDNYGIVVYD